ncbi:gamma-butyrobetaine dioxygenase-like [Anopheles aquasalis]|uniref:gamma-butyrobetaine dioxygenase-like n=1 Tax=Anopheles aquasalis TaxID=42839 RepID=UPI00215A5AA5|nr:gamma-butyrobetaine dioxygenase-like [Anopheles aquasalis]
MFLSRSVSAARRLVVASKTVKQPPVYNGVSEVVSCTANGRSYAASSGTVRNAPSTPLAAAPNNHQLSPKFTAVPAEDTGRAGEDPLTSRPVGHHRWLISKASLSNDDRSRVVLLVLVGDDETSARRYEFPAIWLRDNCQCESCFHAGSLSRVLNWEQFDVEQVHVAAVQPIDGGHSLEVLWKGEDNGNHAAVGHRSVYSVEWLLERSFRPEDSEAYLEEWYRPAPELWGAARFHEVLQEFSYADVLHEDEALRQWIEALIRYGVVMIKGAPLTEHECRRLANRVGFIRKTHYGEEFIVKAKEGTSNVAYLSTPLQMHTDLPYYEYKPGCNLLHCLVQSTDAGGGGANLIADGFYVAERVRREHPDQFRLLSETLVNWTDIGEDEGGKFHSIYRAPAICIGRDGERLERINHSVPQRGSHFCVPIEQVDRWYRAMNRFVRILHEEAVQFRTVPGDILTFSNVRAIHGRTGYRDTVQNTRHLVGAYLDWDEIYSKLRVLKTAAKTTATG